MRRRGVILAVVLVMIGLLALTMAGFVFFVKAETAGLIAHTDGHQSELAAESGLEQLVAVLRIEKHNSQAWFDAPERFRHALVFSEKFDRESDPLAQIRSRREYLDRNPQPPPAWRFSLVAPAYDSVEGAMRYGVTPESSKLHLNSATDRQLELLMQPLLLELGVENPQEIVNAILDWRDEDGDAREGGAENEYYNTLEPPYNAKNGRFDTVEELLFVKGVTAAILYGEDTNRNGILDENENDGGETAPFYDDGDGKLDAGVAPFLTVFTREPDTALDNKPRINLNANIGLITAQVAEQFPNGEVTPATLAFLGQLKSRNFNFGALRSPADLFAPTLPEEPPASQPGEEGQEAPPPEDTGDLPLEVAQALVGSPVTAEELPYIMDRFTTRPLEQATKPIEGLINVNTAPARVLMTIPHMTPELANGLVAARAQVDPEARKTLAWPLLTGVVDAEAYKKICPYITTKAYQFHVESLGYADHVKLARRLEWIVEMVGPLPQIKYHRDLTRLGLAWPIDEERVEVRQQ